MKPSHYVLRGNVSAVGLLYLKKSLSAQSSQTRIFNCWQEGCRLYELELCWLLLWPCEKLINTSSIGAYPVIKQPCANGTVYSTVSLPNEHEYLSGSLVVAIEGEFRAFELTAKFETSPSQWLNLDEFSVAEVSSLGLLPQDPVFNMSPVDGDIRELFDQPKKGPVNSRHGRDVSEGNISSSWVTSLTNYLRQPKVNSVTGQRKPSFREYLSRMIMMSALGRVLGARQAGYMRKMLELFENGSLDQALKHAIPMSDARDAANSTRMSMGLPKVLRSISLTLNRRQASSSYNVGEESSDMLRATYERAFQQLDRSGQHKKAAFVLADLLRDYHRALEYLVKHKEFITAAKLAEGQQMSIEKVIYHWVLAGDLTRAINIARTTHRYQAVIQVISRYNKDVANKLSWEFAELCAKQGNYLQAVNNVWDLTSSKKELMPWIKAGIETQVGAKPVLLVKALSLSCDDYFSSLIELIENGNATQINDCISAFLTSPRTPEISAAAKLTLRYHLQHIAVGKIKYHAKDVKRLLELTDDLTLKHEVRALSLKAGNHRDKRASLQDKAKPLEYKLENVGSSLIYDVVELANGWLLLAKGSAGLELCKPNGTTVCFYSQPCDHIVLSDFGNRALLLSSLDEYVQVNRFELMNRSVAAWCELKMDNFAPSYDGDQWLISRGNKVWSLDVFSDSATALWSVSDLPYPVTALSRSKTQLSFVCIDSATSALQVWRYTLPMMRLNQRDPISQDDLEHYWPRSLLSNGRMLVLNKDNNVAIFDRMIRHTELALNGRLIRDSGSEAWLALQVENSENQVHINVHNIENNAISDCKLKIDCTDLPKNQQLHFRICESRIQIFHSTGRVWIFDLSDGVLELNLTLIP